MIFTSLVLLLTVALAMGTPKLVAKARVSGPGFSIPVQSGKACAKLCADRESCDSANYEQKTGKCKLFTRCAATLLTSPSSKHLHFAKRPPIQEPGYKYHAESDSCLKLIDEIADYAKADAICRDQKGRLVSLSDQGINKLATELLRASKAQYAWVGITDSRYEGNPLLTDGRRVSETGWFPTEIQFSRKDPTRNCWSLSDNGIWVEHHCKTREQYSICQITPY